MRRPLSSAPRLQGMSIRQKILLGTAVSCVLLLLFIVAYLVQESTERSAAEVLAAPRELLYEGGISVEQVNLSSVSMQQSGQSLVLQLGFQGFDAAGRTLKISSIPCVSIYGLRQPARIAIELPNLVAWDYLPTLDLSGQNFVQGIFLHDQTLYLQLRFDVSLSLEGQGGVLKLKMKRAETQHAWPEGYRVVADVADRIGYTALAGTLAGMGMTPALSGDGQEVLMISPVYARQRAAQTFAEMVASLCQQAGSSARPQVISLAEGALPSLQETYAADSSRLVLTKAQALMRDAQILDYAADAGRALVKRAGGAVLLLEDSGVRQPLYIARMPEVIAGALSHDGAIAALSTTQERIMLYQNGQTALTGAPSGGLVRTMAWTDENQLYLMGGNPLRFYWVDPLVEAGTELQARLADQHNGLEGRLVGRKGVLYLQDEEQGIVYRCNPADDSRSACALGYHFDVSQDGTTLAVQTDIGTGVGLKLVDLTQASIQERLIGMGLDLHDFCVSSDGQRVYYLAKQSGDYALYRYARASGTTERLMNLPACTLYPTMEEGTLLLNIQQNGVWWIYRLRLEA